MKSICDHLVVVDEPIKEWDHILQILGGLGPKYNYRVASLITREDYVSPASVHSILLANE